MLNIVLFYIKLHVSHKAFHLYFKIREFTNTYSISVEALHCTAHKKQYYVLLGSLLRQFVFVRLSHQKLFITMFVIFQKTERDFSRLSKRNSVKKLLITPHIIIINHVSALVTVEAFETSKSHHYRLLQIFCFYQNW